jgi:undecaprenyl-diphosphatase
MLLALAAVGWLCTRGLGKCERRLGTHFFVCSLASTVLPHILKLLINQERPDRLTISGHLRGVPFSGNATDAFPSGHALHVGGIASAATLLPPKYRNAIWAAGGILVTTRIVLLAHWFTDVLAGLALGVSLERIIRLLTKPETP